MARDPSPALALPDGILLECVVTTVNPDESINVAPMGPIVDWPITRALLRPFQSSTTFANLKRTGCGILHIIDDVELIARAALNLLDETPRFTMRPDGQAILADVCRWYALRVEALDESNARSEIQCVVTDQETLRDFPGFNRAMYAVIEATIAATRLNLLEAEDVLAEIQRLRRLVDKTGSLREHRAFELVCSYVEEHVQVES